MKYRTLAETDRCRTRCSTNDPLGYMRYLYTIPTMESMNREAPRREKPLTAQEVVAQNQKERAARQAGRRQLSPASPSRKANAKQSQDSQTGSRDVPGLSTKGSEDTDGEASESESEAEDGYMSSSSSSSRDMRRPSSVRQDVLAEVHGAFVTSRNQDESCVSSGESKPQNGSTSAVPESIKPEAHENIIYLAGNSLGLQSKSSYQLVNEELMMWQTK